MKPVGIVSRALFNRPFFHCGSDDLSNVGVESNTEPLSPEQTLIDVFRKPVFHGLLIENVTGKVILYAFYILIHNF